MPCSPVIAPDVAFATRRVDIGFRETVEILEAGFAAAFWRQRADLLPTIRSQTPEKAALSATSIVTGVFVAEIIFNFKGVSQVILSAMGGVPDAPAALGFAVYSVCLVLVLMFILDVLQAALDPRVREGVLKS